MRRRIVFVATVALSGCISVTAPDSGNALAGAPTFPEFVDVSSIAPEPFVGLRLGEQITGSLDVMEFMAGLRVEEVVAGSPAETAGLRVGDVVVRADDAELAKIDAWNALLAAKKPGDSIALTVDRGGALGPATLAVLGRESGNWRPSGGFLERSRLRCIASTQWSESAPGKGRSSVLLESCDPGSPLLAAGLRPGSTITRLDGQPVASASDLFRRVSTLEPGRTVVLQTSDGGVTTDHRVELAGPERHLTEFSCWPLFTWSEAADESRGEWSIVDLWLIWLVKHEHDGAASKSSVLRFIRWESGVGELSEEGAEPRR